jgi:hypothetical protein
LSKLVEADALTRRPPKPTNRTTARIETSARPRALLLRGYALTRVDRFDAILL